MWLYFVCSSSRCGYCIAIVGIWSPRTSHYASIWRSSNGAGIGPRLAPGWAAGASNPAAPRTEGPLLLTIGTIRYHVRRYWRGELLAPKPPKPPQPRGSWSAHGEGKT